MKPGSPITLLRMARSRARNSRALLMLALCSGAVACARRAGPTAAGPSPAPGSPGPAPGASAPSLPPVPLVQGPLALHVTYPPADYAITSRDSNFIFGTVGNGRASLTINGLPARVWPNGAFLAFVPNPPADAPRYDLVAAVGQDTARLSHAVRIAPARQPLPVTGPLTVDTPSVGPQGTLLLHDNEVVRVSVRAPPNASAFVATSSGRQPLAWIGGETFAADIPARLLRGGDSLVGARDADTVRFPLAHVDRVDTLPPRWVQLGDSTAAADTDRVVIGRPIPAGTYKWMLLPGTVVQQTGRSGDNIRVRLDSSLEIWVDTAGVIPLSAGTLAPRRVLGPMNLVPTAEWVDVVMPMASRPPF